MEINLEKIELVKDRTGASYAEAKEALEAAEGSVVDAIIALEEKMNKSSESAGGAGIMDNPVIAKMKEIVEKGNVSRILITKDDKDIVNFPVTAGVVGAVLVPWGAILGIVAALGTGCRIDFVDENGEVFDLDGKVIGVYDKAKGLVRKGMDKAQETLVKAGVDSEKVEKVGAQIEDIAYKTSDKINELGEKGADKVSKAWENFDGSAALDEIKGAIASGAAKLSEMWDKFEKSVSEESAEAEAEKPEAEDKAPAAPEAAAAEEAAPADTAEEMPAADAEAAAEEEKKDEEK